VLGPSEGGLGGQDAPDRFSPSRRNAYTSGANDFFADEMSARVGKGLIGIHST